MNAHSYRTSEGIVSIVTDGQRFFPVFEGELFGVYDTREEAIAALRAGTTDPFPRGIDTTKLGIPADISEWEKIEIANHAGGH